MKRLARLPAAALVVISAGAAAQGGAYDPKALARYDHSYSRCEATFPEMKGHRDEAYLRLWRAQADEKHTAKLAGIRSSGAYKAEQKEAVRSAKAASADAVKALERQCRGLWGEVARTPQATK